MKRRAKASAGTPRERRTFPAEFKADAVRMLIERRASGVSVAQIARELEVRPEQLRLWTKAQGAERARGAAVPGETLEQENRRLRRENAILRQEQAFAKKVAVYFAKESR